MARTKRRSYTGSKRFDITCRNHGGCPFCERGRLRYRKVADDIEGSQLTQRDLREIEEEIDYAGEDAHV